MSIWAFFKTRGSLLIFYNIINWFTTEFKDPDPSVVLRVRRGCNIFGINPQGPRKWEFKNFSGGVSNSGSPLGGVIIHRTSVIQLEDGGPNSNLPCKALVMCSGEIMIVERLKEFTGGKQRLMTLAIDLGQLYWKTWQSLNGTSEAHTS